MIATASTNRYTLTTVVTENKITVSTVKTIQSSNIEGRCWNLDGVPSELVLTVDSYEQVSGEFVINSTNHIGHKVYISDDNITFTLLTTLLGTSHNFIATGLMPSTTYYFKVVAYKVDITSPFELTANAETEAILPITINSITVEWDNINDEFDITVYASGGTGTYIVTYTQNLNILNVVVTDTIGTTANQNVNLNDISPIVIDSATYEVIDNVAHVTIVASGGFGDLTYTLGAESNQTGLFEITEANTYAIEVSDEGGVTPATSSIEITIAVPTPIINSLTVLSDTEISVDYTSDYSVEVWVSTNNVEFTKHGDSIASPYQTTSLSTGTLYYIKVRAIDEGNYSQYSDTFSAETYQAESQLYFTAASTPTVEKANYNRFIKNMKTSGVWTKLAWLTFYATTTEEQSLINMISPGTNNPELIGVTLPTFTAQKGYKNTGVGAIKTNFNPSTSSLYTRYDAVFGCFIVDDVAEDNIDMGLSVGTGWNSLYTKHSTNKVYARINQSSSGSMIGDNADSKGIYVVNRISSGTSNVVKDNNILVSGTATTQAVTNGIFYELALNDDESLLYPSTKTHAAGFFGDTLTTNEIADLTAGLYELYYGTQFAEIYDDTKLIDGVVYADLEDFNSHTAFSTFKFTTNATIIKIKAHSTLYDALGKWGHLTIKKDEAILSRVQITSTNYIAVYLGEGLKVIEVIEEGTSKPSTAVLGTYIESILSNGTTNTIDESNPTDRLLFIGDSITVGANADYLFDGWSQRFKQAGRNCNWYGWGYGTIYDIASTDARRTITMSFINPLLDGTNSNKIVIHLGTNDYALNKSTPNAMQTSLSNLLGRINADNPTATVVLITPFIRGTETANTLGYTADDYRIAIVNAASEKTYVSVIDGKSILLTSDLEDGVHPANDGHLKAYNALKTLF